LHRTSSLVEWINYLESLQKGEIHLGLDRVNQVANHLELNKPACPVITVAGTNGKGSTVAVLEQIYFQAGYKTASYTSPHILTFNERMKWNTCPLNDDTICHALSIIEQERLNLPLTYFEMVTLAALWQFKQWSPDVMILEVGLGGRKDAVNVVDADFAIITSIDFDHQQFLGSTIEEIAFEKAGILREGQPFIYADQHLPETIKTVAKDLNCDWVQYGKDYFYEEWVDHWNLIQDDTCLKALPKSQVNLKSASSAIITARILNPTLPVDVSIFSKALNKLHIPGRLEFIPGNVNLLFDVAHNPQSARLLADYLKTIENSGKVHSVFSALCDKDIKGLLDPLKNCVHHWYIAQLNIKRAADSIHLLETAQQVGIDVNTCYESPSQAFLDAKAKAKTGDIIVVYGSFYTVSEIMESEHMGQ